MELMMALNIWWMEHGVVSLFGRGETARRKLAMSPEDLLEAGVLIYLRGLGFLTERNSAGPTAQPEPQPSGPWGSKPK